MVLAHDIRVQEGTARRTADIATDTDVAFDSMLLAPRTLAGLKAAGFLRPSPVQLQGIPTGKCGFDLLLEAKSGTGKTVVFAVIALEMLESNPDAQIMILAPTREIASQITDVTRQIGSEFKGLRVEVVMGGLPVSEDIEKFANKRKVHIIVGSPGRLRHLIEDNHISTSSVRLFILDEADKLMEGTFKADINYIFSSLPNRKQVIMSSATYPTSLKELVVKYMNKYIHVCPNSTSVLLGIEQKLTIVKQHANIITQTQHRYKELVKILKSRQFKQCLIFCNYQARVVEVCKKLKADKWPAQFLHGKQEQTDRLDALKTLQDYKCRILVSTDLAARGIDASNVDLIINFEIPYEWPTYLHRIGRAGRYGSYGMAISIVAQGKEEENFKALLKAIGAPVNMKMLWTEEPLQVNDINGDAENDIKQNGAEVKLTDNIAIPSMLASSDKLWDVINNRDGAENDDDGTIEMVDFDNLNASYNNTDGIESFENLFNSFEASNIEKIEIPFATLKADYKTIASNLFANLGQPNFEVKAIKDPAGKNEDKVSKVIGKSSKSAKTKNERNYPHSFKNEKPNMRLSHRVENKNNESDNNNNTNRDVLNGDDENSDVEDNYRSDQYENSFTEEINENYEDDNELTVRSRRDVQNRSGYVSEHKTDSDSEDSSSESGSSTGSSISDSTSEYNSSEMSDDEQVHLSQCSQKQSELMSRHSYLISAVRNYEGWKRELAARRAQIQVAVYIQELAKINKR